MASELQRLRVLLPWLALAVVLAGILTAAVSLMTPAQVGFMTDDAMYITTAHALADGLGYRYPFSPGLEPATRYPILFPAMLAGIARLVSDPIQELLIMQWHSLLHLMLFLALSFAFLIRFLKTPWPLALAAILLLGFNPIVLNLSGQVMSDIPFASLSMLALLAVGWAVEKGTWQRLALAGALVALACMVRYQGITLLGAGILVLWAGKRFREGMGLGLAFAATMLPWGWWVWTHKAMEYGSNFQQMTGGLGLGKVLRELSRSAHFMVAKALPGAYLPGLTPFSESDGLLLATPPGVILLGYGLSLVTLLGMVVALARPRSAVERLVALYGLLTIGLVVAWNAGYNYLGYWQTVRLMLALMPFFVYFGYRFLDRVVPAQTRARTLMIAVLGIGGVVGVIGAGQAFSVERQMVPEYLTRARAFSQAYAFVRTRIPREALMASTEVPILFLNTGRKGENIFLSPEWFYQNAGRSRWDYLFVVPLLYAGQDVAQDFVLQTTKRYPDLLQLAFYNPKSGISIWKIDRAAAPSQSP